LLATLVFVALASAPSSSAVCTGDCDADGRVTVDELLTAVGAALHGLPVESCEPADANGDGRLSIADLVLGVARALDGCPPDETPTTGEPDGPTPTVSEAPSPAATDTPAGTPTETPTPTITPTFTPAPPSLLRLRLRNESGAKRTVRFSGVRLDGPPAAGGTEYGPLTKAIQEGDSELDLPADLAPGVWLHHAVVVETRTEAETPHVQHQQSLLVSDPADANLLDWTLFRTVLTVNRDGDDGRGSCSGACTLRDAIATAASSPAPVLVRFAHEVFRDGRARISITENAALRIESPGTMIDGRDERGNPSPLEDFRDRVYPTTIVLSAANAGPDPEKACPCRESPGGAIRVVAPNVRLEGLEIRRVLAPEGSICCGDQDLVAFGTGSANGRLETCRLDGGAAGMTSAEVPKSAERPSTGKDCIDAESTGASAEAPVRVANSELRFCHDRAVKSQEGVVLLEGNWIHHNLRGGIFAQSPFQDGGPRGLFRAIGNLIERNGQNCPTGDPADCGAAHAVTRSLASEIAAEGSLTQLFTRGNVIRDGVRQGILLQHGSQAEIVDDYVCGIGANTAGIGIRIDRGSLDGTPDEDEEEDGDDEFEEELSAVHSRSVREADGALSPPPSVSLRGTSVVFSGETGVRLNGELSVADFGTDGLALPGRNAFAANGDRTKRNFVNASTEPGSIVAAEGNQWQHCYPPAAAVADACEMSSISDRDTNNTLGVADRVHVASAEPHQSSAAVEIDDVSPARIVQNGLVRISGRGFDAISGHAAAAERDCSLLAASNSCEPLEGTCVEFQSGDGWLPAADVLAVTPTHLVVRAPLTCTVPTTVRVRRSVLGGGEVSAEAPFCRNLLPTPTPTNTVTPTPSLSDTPTETPASTATETQAAPETPTPTVETAPTASP
jgi:hypothetical protein